MPINIGHGFKIITRAEWKARSPKKVTPWGPKLATGKTVHYSTGEELGRKDTAAWCRSIQNYHMDGQGWWDIAYNWLIDREGRIFEGRGLGARGGHAGTTAGNNTYGVCFLGDDDPGQDVPDIARDAFAALGLWIDQQGVRKPWYGHRDWKSTACPGDELYGLLPALNASTWTWLTATTGGTTYVVRAGDTLTSIGRRFGVSVDELVAWNGIANPDVIQVGARLQVAKPTTPTPPPAPAPTPKPKPKPPTSKPWRTVVKDGMPVTKKGDRGRATAIAQTCLAARGILPANTFAGKGGSGKPDPIFGDGTHAAVKTFEKQVGYRQDGILANDSWDKLIGSMPVRKSGSPGGVGTRIVQGLLAANGISMAHSWTGTGYDGDFGPSTIKATRSFQAARKLKVDGIFGRECYTAALDV